MMHLARELKVVRSNNFTIVELPYGQGNYTMVIALPDKNMTIMNAVNSLNYVSWNNWMNLLSDSNHFAQLYFPRFKYQYKRTLNNDLVSLGMGRAFSDQADFSNISTEFMKISRVLHQTAIENNEEGTEAEAATVVEFVYGGANPASAETISVDHPFLYFIRESSTGTIMFMGLVQDPTVN
jgi:serine protease inhibitor